jgi:hypothetical protein
LFIREGDPEEWSSVLTTALGSCEKPLPHSYTTAICL